MILRTFLPERHLGEESRKIVTSVGIGLVGAMAGLVLALLITGAQNSFNNKRSELINTSAKIVYLDEILADYGPETKEARALLRRSVISIIDEYWPGDVSQHVGLEPDMTNTKVLFNKIRSLDPRSDDQRSLRDKALTTSLELAQMRNLLIVEQGKSIPGAFQIVLVLLVFWLASIFFSLGIYAPPNSTVVAILVLFALLVAIAFFLIIDLNLPFEGVLRIPSTPLTEALNHIGK
jgi:hypothetical protein